MFIKDKYTEIFRILYDFSNFYDALMTKYIVKDSKKPQYYRDGDAFKG